MYETLAYVSQLIFTLSSYQDKLVKNQSHSTDPFNGMTFTNIGRINLGKLMNDLTVLKTNI